MSDTKSTGGKFQFVGASERKTGDKIDWPLEVEATIIKAYLDKVGTAKAIFASALPLLNEIRAKKGQPEVVELPKSYRNTNAGSLLHGMRTRFLKRINEGNDKETLEVAAKFGIIETRKDETAAS